jgi:hypothetical protein
MDYYLLEALKEPQREWVASLLGALMEEHQLASIIREMTFYDCRRTDVAWPGKLAHTL